MAYGQTGSGKTFTMIGGGDDRPGLYFSSVQEIFRRLDERQAVVTDQRVKVSVVEIYNEQIRDLLAKKGDPLVVKLRDNGEGETVSNERLKTVRSREEAMKCLRKACLNRATGATAANEQSSRSHFIFSIHVTWKHALSKAKYCGKLNLVDLAGSERLSKYQTSTSLMQQDQSNITSTSNPHTFALQERLRERETLLINQSLTTLGKVFLALTPAAPPSTVTGVTTPAYVPYRDSKLTHFLKDSLGGESKTMLIV
jgi:hypothetical protein